LIKRLGDVNEAIELRNRVGSAREAFYLDSTELRHFSTPPKSLSNHVRRLSSFSSSMWMGLSPLRISEVKGRKDALLSLQEMFLKKKVLLKWGWDEASQAQFSDSGVEGKVHARCRR